MKGMKRRLLAFALVLVMILTNAMLVSAEETASESRISEFTFGTNMEATTVTFWANATLNEGEKLIAGYITALDKAAGSTQMTTVELKYVGGAQHAYEKTVEGLPAGTYYVENLQIISSNDEVVETCTKVDGYEMPTFTIGQSSGSQGGNQGGTQGGQGESCKHTNVNTWETNNSWSQDGKISYELVTQCMNCGTEISRETVEFYQYGVEIVGYGVELEYKVDMGEGTPDNPIYTEVVDSGIYTTVNDKDGTIGEQISGMIIFDKNPTKAGATFEGWAKFYWEAESDEEYAPMKAVFQKKSAAEPYYTLDEMLDETPTRNVAYAAKWSDIAIEDYYEEHSISFEAYGDGSVVKYQKLMWNEETEEEYWGEEVLENYDCRMTSSYVGVSIESQLEIEGIRFVEEPTKAGASFEGWAKFSVDTENWDYTFIPQSATKQYYTTEEMLALPTPNYDVAFLPKWSDISIEDYYPDYYDVVLDLNGGELEYTYEMDGETYIYSSEIEYFNTTGSKSLQTTLESADASITGVRNNGKILDSWKVYEIEAMDIFVAREGDEIPKSDDEQLVVYYYTYEEEGVKEDTYLVFKGYKVVDEAMSTEKLLTQYAGVNYYAVASWKDSVAVVEDTKVKESLASEQKAVVDAIVNDTVKDSVVSEETAANVKAAVEAGQEISTELVVYPMDEALVNSSEKADILNAAAKELGSATNVQFLDIQVLLKVDDAILGNINELQKEIEITVAIPEDMKADGAEYVVIRNHDGEIDVLPATVNADGTITFKTDKFSTYALAYAEKDSTGSTGNGATGSRPSSPATGDNSMILGYAMACVAALAVVVVLKKKESYI